MFDLELRHKFCHSNNMLAVEGNVSCENPKGDYLGHKNEEN